MYYYGNNGYYGSNFGGYSTPCCGGYAGYTTGYGLGAAIWIVLFILLVIIIGAGWFGYGNNNN
ncbi:MAG: sporulation protein YjcZ [Bacilli bacterium]|nr:sporulation protein YjcZ [Bacilli bacterium]